MANRTSIRVARGASITLSVPFLSIVAFLAVIWLSPMDIPNGLGWSLVSLAFALAGTMLYPAMLRRFGRDPEQAMNGGLERVQLTLIMFAGYFAAWLVLTLFGAPLFYRALALSFFAVGHVAALINLWWRISLHCAVVVNFAVALIILFGPAAWVSAALVPIASWARVTLGAHNVAQVAASGVMGVILSAAVWWIYGYLPIVV
ncbi:MAG: hypothetical protein HYX89_01270 [Chloroflexi bacterium]|nr:hypothetical protein [Chloroflexota bacterium]